MNWIKQNKLEFAVLALIILITLFVRFYKLDQYMTFLGDEGRDALMVKRILERFDFPLLGPPTSVGNVYLGPLYYYLMAISMAIFYLNPVAAAGMVALITTLAVLLIYYLSREWFGTVSAISASLLYSLSPVNIIYSKSSWNPNPAPFFALLAILGLHLSKKYGNYLWLILTGIGLGAAVQMHYLALILIPIVLVIYLQQSKTERKLYFKRGTILAILVFLFLLIPLVIFDVKYGFTNFNHLVELFKGESSVSFNLLTSFSKMFDIYFNKLTGRFFLPGLFSYFLGILILVPLLAVKKNWGIFVLTIWLVLGIIGLGFYKSAVYDHYLGFLNPVPFILFGSLFWVLPKLVVKLLPKLILVGAVFLLLINFISDTPLQDSPNNQLARTQEIAKFIISEAKGQDFNFALLAERNYDAAYQFYLDLYGYKPKVVPFEITEQLFVVCEMEICQPINNPKYEIAAYGWAKVESIKEVQGLKVFKLIANPTGKAQ